jgi:LysM repeat protein
MSNGNIIQYKVKAGDTLSAIAKQYGISINAILAINPQITDPNLIFIGQIILIPVAGAKPTGQPAGGTLKGLDAAVNLTQKAKCLRNQGFDFAVRYYNVSNSQTFPEKRLTLTEAKALVGAGFLLGVVFQQAGNAIGSFNRDIGVRHGKRAHDLAVNSIGQPAGSAIYFSVDFDASASQIDGPITSYFKSVRDAMAEANGGAPRYQIGVYGSGLTCSKLLAKGLVSLTWLAQSMGFRGSKEFAEQKRFNLRQFLPKVKCGIDHDPDDTNPDKPSGLFTIPVG